MTPPETCVERGQSGIDRTPGRTSTLTAGTGTAGTMTGGTSLHPRPYPPGKTVASWIGLKRDTGRGVYTVCNSMWVLLEIVRQHFLHVTIEHKIVIKCSNSPR